MSTLDFTTPIPGPDWIDTLIRSTLGLGVGMPARDSGAVGACETDRDEQPLTVVAAAHGGLVYVDYSEVDDGEGSPEVTYLDWRKIEGITLDGDTIRIHATGFDGRRPLRTITFNDDVVYGTHDSAIETRNIAAAHTFFASLARLQSRS